MEKLIDFFAPFLARELEKSNVCCCLYSISLAIFLSFKYKKNWLDLGIIIIFISLFTLTIGRINTLPF